MSRRPLATVRVPRVAIVVSPRDWAQALHRHVADHGGALVRARVLDAREALDEDYDVLVCEDLTSFLNRRIVARLHQLGRTVLGLHDPDDITGEQRLRELGVDAVIRTDVEPDVILAHVATLATSASDLDEELRQLVMPPPQGGGDHVPTRAPLFAVGGPAGGAGATEVALALSHAMAGRGRTVLLDADLVAPALAQRLDLPLEPNLRTAIDVVNDSGDVLTALHRVDSVSVCAGLVDPRDWPAVDPDAFAALASELRRSHDVGVADLGHRLDPQLPGLGRHDRHAIVRDLVGEADVVVAVTAPHPVGVSRLLEWLADARTATSAPVHLVVNGIRDRFTLSEVEREIQRTVPLAASWSIPWEPRVAAAAWDGRIAGRRSRRRTFARLADGLLAHVAAPR